MSNRRVIATNVSGFTLIEVLIGMSLLSVMMVLLLSSLRICIQNWDAGEKKIADVNQLAVLQKFFTGYLQGIRPLQDNFSLDEPVFSFQGDNGNLQFVASMPASAGRMGLQFFRIGLQPAKETEGNLIMVSIAPFFPLMEGEEWKLEEVVVLEQVKKLEFNYFGSLEIGEPGAWETEWVGIDHLPELVQVVIELENGEVWPPFIVAPRNEVNLQSAAGAGQSDGNDDTNDRESSSNRSNRNKRERNDDEMENNI